MDISELSDTQSEGGLIGTLIYHPEFILHTEYLQPNYFYELNNSCIYWAIRALYESGITNIDAYNLSSMLQSNVAVSRSIEKYNLPSVQEFVELYKLTARHTLEEYKMLADNIVTLAFKREFVKAINQITSDIFEPDNGLVELSNSTYDRLDKLTENFIINQEVSTLGDKLDDIWAEIESRRNSNGGCGIPSKHNIFNEYFTYEPGELVMIQARYKEGKSVFLMNEVVHKLKNGVPTLVIDTEMNTRLYTERLLSHLSGIDIKRVKTGQYSAEEAQKLRSAMSWLKRQPFDHIYKPEITDKEIYSYCQIYKKKYGLQFFVFDYIKSDENETSTNYNILGKYTNFLKNSIAGKLELSVLSACQLNRNYSVADSDKINRYLSVAIKWGHKTQEMIAKDGIECGNAFAKIYVNRLGPHMLEDDEDEYIDFLFDGNHMSIVEAKQHKVTSEF